MEDDHDSNRGRSDYGSASNAEYRGLFCSTVPRDLYDRDSGAVNPYRSLPDWQFPVANLGRNTLPAGLAIFGNTRRNVIIGTLVAAALFPGGLYVGIGNELCLSWSSIKMRDNTLSPVRKYVWSDVMELHTECSMHGSRRGRHQAVGARFLLADGDSFWLSVIEYGHVFDALSRVLRGTKYKFDDSDIDETCSPENHALFSRLP